MSHGLLLFAHGARDPAWALPFRQARERLLAQHGADTPVALAFLEFMSPTLLEAGAQLADQGCQRVTVVPLFLGAGGHVRKDLPVLIDQLRQSHPGTAWHLAPAVGETDTVVRALADAAWQLAHADVPPDGATGGAA
ncbi:MAG TPA: CbiX/SirB N-terminal domain-containing protein [Candidatus Aquabacterium excrementipullorum]|nr:CbiX/SirB N-terminal domain-containing protein [Candidatus Aquabacterium excrementipullorum]